VDDEIIKYLKASVALQAEIVARLEGATRPEILMGAAGLTHKEIAALVGKQQPAVSKIISRAKLSRKENDDE
jgi:predicted transcriptional regulator